jgi:phosphoglycerol transferase MdoB-like AlkP superfamily enzyme
MSSDVLPTIYNLFGIEYDSRLFTGKDILSDDFGIVILSDRSWITEEGVYNASENEFTPKQEVEVEDNYVETINQLVNNRLNISREIIENDYYSYLIVENE